MNLSNKNKFQYFILIIFLIISNISCKDKEQKKIVINKQEKNIVNSKTIDSCFINNQKISLIKKENKEFIVKLDNKTTTKNILLNKLNLAIQNIADVHINCNLQDQFQIVFTENIGNSKHTTYHFFEQDKITKEYVWSKIYKTASNRQGISIFGINLKDKIKFENYDAQEDLNLPLLSIYSFNGYQEEKEPIIDAYYNKIKSFYKNQNTEMELFGNEMVINYLIQNIAINNENLSQYNDIAYYLEQSKLYPEAIFLLEKIIKNFPNRTVAYINLGDAYWGLNKKSKAKEAYKTYVNQMKSLKKENKIPKQVLDKLN